MIPNYCISDNTEIIIKLDDQEELLMINNQTLKIQLYEGFYTIIHHKSRSFGTSKSKLEAYKKLIRSKRFQQWYNRKIAQVVGYEHIEEEKWQAMTKQINFQIKKGHKWLDINESFFLKDFYNINFDKLNIV